MPIAEQLSRQREGTTSAGRGREQPVQRPEGQNKVACFGIGKKEGHGGQIMWGHENHSRKVRFSAQRHERF